MKNVLIYSTEFDCIEQAERFELERSRSHLRMGGEIDRKTERYRQADRQAGNQVARRRQAVGVRCPHSSPSPTTMSNSSSSCARSLHPTSSELS